jgi:serine/threonine-protein kinase
VPLREKRGDAPDGLETVILRCIEKDPERRAQSIAELATQLSEFAPRRSRTSLERIAGILGVNPMSMTEPAVMPGSGAQAPPRETGATWQRTQPPSPTRWPLLGVAMGIAAVGAAGLWLAIGRVPAPSSEPARPGASGASVARETRAAPPAAVEVEPKLAPGTPSVQPAATVAAVAPAVAPAASAQSTSALSKSKGPKASHTGAASPSAGPPPEPKHNPLDVHPF